MEVLEGAGIDRYLLQMANIREHCTWVTQDETAATRKARAMIDSALARVKRHEPIERKQIECNTDVLVVGGGIAGIEAALMAADAGRNVTLLDAAMSFGGQVPQLEEVAPNRECAPCLIAPRLSDVEDHPNITRLTGTTVEQIVGYFGNFGVHATSRPRWVDLELCIGCDECMKACPAQTDSPYQRGLAKRKAIDIPFPGSVPNCAEIDPQACQATAAEQLRRGNVLIAPGGQHLLVTRGSNHCEVRLKDGPRVDHHRPSIDVAFMSLARAAGRGRLRRFAHGHGRRRRQRPDEDPPRRGAYGGAGREDVDRLRHAPSSARARRCGPGTARRRDRQLAAQHVGR
jgi:ferredoxin